MNLVLCFLIFFGNYLPNCVFVAINYTNTEMDNSFNSEGTSKKTNNPYAVVKDLPMKDGEETYSIVASKWIYKKQGKTMCWWPPITKMNTFLKKLREPSPDWSTYNVEVVAKYETLEEARMKEMKLVEYENTSDEETFRKRKFPLKYQEYCSFIPPPTLTQPNEETSLSSNSSSKESLKESNADGSCCKSPTTDKPEKMESVLSGNKNLVELPTCGEKTTSNQVNVYDSHRPKDNISIDITGINVEAAAYAQLQGMLTHISGQLAECLVWHKSHSDRLDKIENKYQNKALHTTQNELYGMFPIDSKVKLDKLEEKLVDAEFKRVLVNWLGMIGGKDYRSCAFATLQKVFSISFAPTLSWAGRNNNLAVKELAIISSIHDAIKKSFPDCTESNFHESTKDWLRAANQRLLRVQKKKLAVTENQD